MKPDFSTIEPMACKCKDIPERDEILRQLKEWGVPFGYKILDDEIFIDWATNNGLKSYGYAISSWKSNIDSHPEDSPSDFLSKFREVYEASKAPVAANGIVFPSDEEVGYHILRSMHENKLDLIEWFKQRTIELTPHLKV